MSHDDVMKVLDETYLSIKRVRRELRPQDRIVEDLGIDSLAAIELMVALESRYNVQLVDNPRVAAVVTVQDLVALLDNAVAARG
jgi:acyl carrier protein